MKTSPIRSDEKGLYVRTGGYVFRPGSLRGYERSIRMDDAGLAAGDRVAARHRGGTPTARLTLADGTVTHWGEEETARKDAVETPAGLAWTSDGRRDLDRL